jgi:hypothetical protein
MLNKTLMKTKRLSAITLIPLLLLSILFSGMNLVNDPKLILDKPGMFKVLTWSIYGMSGTNYTAAEADVNYYE